MKQTKNYRYKKLVPVDQHTEPKENKRKDLEKMNRFGIEAMNGEADVLIPKNV